MTDYDPARYAVEQWGLRGLGLRIIAVGTVLFWLLVGIGLFIAITARP